ncbi:unnamed protein product, partial [Amoebophrya sp. A120]
VCVARIHALFPITSEFLVKLQCNLGLVLTAKCEQASSCNSVFPFTALLRCDLRNWRISKHESTPSSAENNGGFAFFQHLADAANTLFLRETESLLRRREALQDSRVEKFDTS